MGYELVTRTTILKDGREKTIQSYSTSIAAAWEVVKKLRSKFGQVEVYGADTPVPGHPTDPDDDSDLTFWDCLITVDGCEISCSAGTAELAICRAAIKAMDYDNF